MKRRVFITGLALMTVFSTFTSTMAEVAPESTFHAWATSTLNDGEKYGIYPISWYDNMQAIMTKKQLTSFCSAIGDKLLDIEGVTRGDKEASYPIEGEVTREAVLQHIYATITNFKYQVEIDFGKDMLTYMAEQGVVLGDTKELHLGRACTLEEAAMFGTRIIDTLYTQLDAGAKGLLWKIENAGNTVYMLGSIHIANYDIYPFNQEILEAFDASETLAVELNFYDTQGMNDFLNLAVYTDGTKLDKVIPEELYTKVLEACSSLGIPKEQMDLCKPWYLANTLTTYTSSSSQDDEDVQVATLLGIDNYLISKALIEGKNIYELESYQYQGELFDNFSPELQACYLEGAVEGFLNPEVGDESVDSIDTWLEDWEKGELGSIVAAFADDEALAISDVAEINEEYTEKLLTNRDENMTDKIDKMLNRKGENTYFVVVGAGHYVGKNGVLTQLKEKGYTITQVK